MDIEEVAEKTPHLIFKVGLTRYCQVRFCLQLFICMAVKVKDYMNHAVDLVISPSGIDINALSSTLRACSYAVLTGEDRHPRWHH